VSDTTSGTNYGTRSSRATTVCYGVIFANSEIPIGAIVDGTSNTLIVGERTFAYDFLCVGMYDFQIVDDVNICMDILESDISRKRPWCFT
jgi:hypothetical protein